MGFVVLFLLWARHMYTVGLSIDSQGVVVLTLLAVFDVLCIGGGIYLLNRPKKTLS